MGTAALRQPEPLAPDFHPRCPVCAVPMWLVKIMRHADPRLTRKQFKDVQGLGVPWQFLPVMNDSGRLSRTASSFQTDPLRAD